MANTAASVGVRYLPKSTFVCVCGRGGGGGVRGGINELNKSRQTFD